MSLKKIKMISISIAIVAFLTILIYIVYSMWYYNVYINQYHPEKETLFYRVYGTGFHQPGLEEVIQTGVDPKYRYTYKEITRYIESYIIVNAPDNVTDLKREITKFEKSVGFDEKEFSECDRYVRRYIKESKDMKRDWKPNNSYMCYDPGEDYHYDHIVAVTCYSKSTGKTVYNIHPKDSDFKEVDQQFFEE